MKKLFSLLLLFMVVQLNAQTKNFGVSQGTYKTIFDMLRDVPGLDVKPSNDKSGGSVIIRGVGSLTNQKNPLVVMDGVVYNGDISNINPQDVETVTVLKDAASASAYGAQGAAGVIVITTLKGKTGGGSSTAKVSSFNGSAYTYFINNKVPIRVFGQDGKVIVEGVIQQQRDSVLVFTQKRKELLVPIRNIDHVEMLPRND
jgi:TonB-dependent SusC/RagA subfamily outer membrane receptor